MMNDHELEMRIKELRCAEPAPEKRENALAHYRQAFRKADACLSKPKRGNARMTPPNMERRNFPHHRNQAAFTLVELLVVVAILSILAAMLLPALSRAVETARQTQCANNQRQIYLVFQQYADSASGYIPLCHYWMKLLARVDLVDPKFPLPEKDPGIWACPTFLPKMRKGYPWNWRAKYRGGYSQNEHIGATTPNPQDPLDPDIDPTYCNSKSHWGVRRIDTLPAPSRYFHTVECAHTGGDGRVQAKKGETIFQRFAGAPHADGRSVLGFFDGHVTAQFLPPKLTWSNSIEPWEP